MVDASNEFNIAILEGEVVWGQAIDDAAAALRDVIGELDVARFIFYTSQQRDSGVSPDDATANRKIVFRSGPDEFEAKVADAIAAIEAFVRPRLRL